MIQRVASICLLCFLVCVAASATADERKKIVLIAGPKSHGPIGNRIHDYPWSVKLLKVMLDNSNVREKVRVEYHLDGWPKDPSTFDDADTILVVSDGRDGDKYQEAPHFRDAQQTARIQEQINRGCGFATFHFSTFAPDANQQQSFQWTGGYFDWETNGKKQWYSAIKTLDAPVSLTSPKHAVLRGVKPFKMREEFYYNIRFADEGVTSLWTVPALDGREPDGKVVAWAKVRPDGGRGFGTTCGHFYDNWKHASFRRTILNALVWTAGLEPPAEGVDAPFYTHEQITLALSSLGEEQGEGSDKPALVDARPIRVRLFAGNEAHAWHNWKKTTPAIKELLQRDPRIRVEVSTNIEDLAKLDRQNTDVVVQNYVNWKDPAALSDASKTAFSDFLKSGGGLVLVHFANGAFHFSLPDGAGASDWPEYRNIVRRVWNHHGEGEAQSGHDAFGRFDVRVTDMNHVLTRGLKPTFNVEDELYFRQDGADPISPLIVARSKVTNRHEPLAWTYAYGKGRVFQTLLGHSEKTYDAFEPRELLRRAVAWTAGRTPLEMEPQRDLPPKPKEPAKAAGAASRPKDQRLVVEGKVGQAFNARAARLHVASGERFRKPPLTVDFWTKLNGRKSYNILVASETKKSLRHWEIFTVAGSGQLSLYIPGSQPDHVHTGVNICDATWRRVRMVWEADRVRFWVDGKPVADQSIELREGPSRKEPLAFGGLVAGDLTCDGSIDQMLIRAGAHPPPRPNTRIQQENDTLGFWSFDALNENQAFSGRGEAAGEARPFEQPAQTESRGRLEKARPAAADHWGRTVVGFDWTESDSADGRWNQTQVGRFLACTMILDGHAVQKGMAVRLGEAADATALYDTKTMQLRAAWHGGFLRFDPARYGLIRHPQPQGEVAFSTDATAAWPNDDFRYLGAYRAGSRHVLAGEVAGARVLDSCWAHRRSGERWIERTIEVAARTRPLTMQLLKSNSLRLVGDSKQIVVGADPSGRKLALTLTRDATRTRATRLVLADGMAKVEIAASTKPVRFSVLYQAPPPQLDDAFVERLASRVQSAKVPNLDALTHGGARQWTAEIATQGQLGDDQSAYAVDTITLPISNPYKALMFVGGHDFFENGVAALCTVHGDVWLAEGIDDDLDVIRWKRYATGLYQPLGLRVLKDRIYVLGRDQITRLHDLNGDGEADFYENFNHDALTSTGTHDYVTCLESDAAGNFYCMHAKQGMLKVSSDGKRLSVVATGFRNPNGMGLGPQGQLTASPQEGEWTPGSNIALVRQGGYYGYGGPKVTAERPLGYDPPWCWIPRRLDNSSGGQVWTEKTWGPLGDRMLHLSFGQCTSMLVLPDESDPQRQAAVIPLPWKFASGVSRGRANPRDGQMYLSGMTGWVSSATSDGCFQRIRYTGKPMLTPVAIKTWRNGLSLRFSQPLDKAYVEDADRYHVEQWMYRYSGSYGSDEYRVGDSRVKGRDELSVRSATLLDERTLFLELPQLRPAMQTAIRFDVRSVHGLTDKNTAYATIYHVPSAGVDANRLARKARPGALSETQIAALRPGLLATTMSADRLTHRVTRMAAIREAAVDKFAWQGYLKSSVRAVYQFKAAGRGAMTLKVNDKEILAARGDLDTAEPQEVELHKGYNRLEMECVAQSKPASIRLLWSGEDFGWEPIPPAFLSHGGWTGGARYAKDKQDARQLFADYRCMRCHDAVEKELKTIDALWLGPDLRDLGKRLNPDWISAWIQDPNAHRSTARMPQMLSGSGREMQQQTADLTAYLVQGESKPSESPSVSSHAVENGLALFESLACIACHRFTPPVEEDEFQRTSLHFAAAKYRAGAITQLLLKPTKHYATTRMPTFALTHAEAASLEAFVRSRSEGKPVSAPLGDPQAGEKLYASTQCAACHEGPSSTRKSQRLNLPLASTGRQRHNCLRPDEGLTKGQPRYLFSDGEREALTGLVHDRERLVTESLANTTRRWMRRLQCVACHDQDSERGRRGAILLDEGELGDAPEVYPSLTWAGEKLHHDWLASFLGGESDRRIRPWLRGRMPAFPAYAATIASGLAHQHGVTTSAPKFQVDPKLAAVGDRLVRKVVGLDCRQCHAVGDQAPTGDSRTKIAPGINFATAKQRLREDYYHRFVLDPPRYEITTKMPRFTLDRKTTPMKSVYGGDAARQFDAIWHYLQALPANPPPQQ